MKPSRFLACWSLSAVMLVSPLAVAVSWARGTMIGVTRRGFLGAAATGTAAMTLGRNGAASDDAIDRYLRDQMFRQHIPGLAVVVLRGGRILKVRGYGTANLEWRTPVDQHTLFQIASATKPIAVTAIMSLAQEGKLALEERIGAYLPDLPAAWKGITVQQLGTHTSGLKDFVRLPQRVETRDELLRLIAPLPLDYRPGEKAAYNQTDYVLLQMLVERVYGKSFPDFLRERLLQPLGMTGARYNNAEIRSWARVTDTLGGRASVYRWEDGVQRSYDYFYPRWAYTAGGLFSSVRDLARWAAALASGRLLEKRTLDRMWKPAVLASGSPTGFAFGWMLDAIEGRPTVGHSGGPALGDILHVEAEGLTTIVLTNQHNIPPSFARAIASMYLRPDRPRSAIPP